jgi:hypothetical protein
VSDYTKWNPRYVVYCRAHGMPDPEEMLKHDRKRWPGGCMTGFLLWIPGRWREYVRLNPGVNLEFLTDADHADFDAWLAVTC